MKLSNFHLLFIQKLAQSRKVSSSIVDTHLKLAAELQDEYPDFVVGFDLVGQEDLGRPLVEFASQLLEAKAAYPKLNFFFHAGETDWQGSQADLNIMDAVLLNATRIGHGYSITKHPEVLKMAKERDIPIEVCPISNQVSFHFTLKNPMISKCDCLFFLFKVLGLVNDLRNHPASKLVLEGYPIVVASDDVASWGAQGLSDDFYEVFMAMSARTSDLSLFKALIWNSIRYSALSSHRQIKCQNLVETKWTSFLKSFINENG